MSSDLAYISIKLRYPQNIREIIFIDMLPVHRDVRKKFLPSKQGKTLLVQAYLKSQ